MTTTQRSEDLSIRRARPADDPAVLDLLRRCLGKRPEDPYEAFFAWKHRANVFGRSPAWVAEADHRVVGYRTFMRWCFVDGGGERLSAVRAVDTATDPSQRGRGIFRRLTLAALQELRAEGVDLVFNTPNDQSRPGYLSMGWQVVGRLPVAARPASLRSLPRIARARAPAAVWSPVSPGGEAAAAVLADPDLAHVLSASRQGIGISTLRSIEYLQWRYGLGDLGYRAFRCGPRPDDGLLICRVRERGEATELAVCEVLAATRERARETVIRALRDTHADYAVGLGMSRLAGMLPLPRQGPILTWLPLTPRARPPEVLSLGDVELF